MGRRISERDTATYADRVEELEAFLEEQIDELDFPELNDLCENAWLLELILAYCKRRDRARS